MFGGWVVKEECAASVLILGSGAGCNVCML